MDSDRFLIGTIIPHAPEIGLLSMQNLAGIWALYFTILYVFEKVFH